MTICLNKDTHPGNWGVGDITGKNGGEEDANKTRNE